MKYSTKIKLRLSIYLFIAFIWILISSQPLYIIGRIYNQVKIKELESLFNNKVSSLILLTVTGDPRYKNIEISQIFKNLQIIHVLVISGSNILIVHHLIHYFIYRKSTTNYLISLLFIYFYGLFISFPETLIRALLSMALVSIVNKFGLKISKYRYLFWSASSFCSCVYLFNLGDSFILSAIYSLAITLHSGVCLSRCKNKWISFISLNAFLTIISSLIFNFNSFSVTCTSFIANIFVSLVYDFAIYLAYILYVLPMSYIDLRIIELIGTVFQYLFLTLNIMNQLTYNVCYE